MSNEKAETIPCAICEQPTRMHGTKRCDRCWELEGLIRRDPEIALRLFEVHGANRLATLKAQRDESVRLLSDMVDDFYTGYIANHSAHAEKKRDKYLKRIQALIAAVEKEGK